MPYCEVAHYQRKYKHHRLGLVAEQDTQAVKLFYRTYGQGDVKVLLIMGLAATHEAWRNQILRLAGTTIPNDGDELAENTRLHSINSQSLDDFASLQETEANDRNSGDFVVASTGIQVCAFDNRGVGKSTAPKSKSKYTTAIMAMDAVALLDHLGWEKAHVLGHSLGAMTACKMAAIVPDRLSSLALLSGTGGGYQTIPKLDWVLVSLAFRFWRAKTPEERALVDLDTHYTQDYLDAMIGEISRRDHLYKEYVRNITANGMQTSYGQSGQLNACWKHQVTSEEYKRISSSSFLVSVIHGRGDVIAQIRHARAIAKRLHPVARMVELDGGHLITHQNVDEVNQEIMSLIQAAESKIHPSDWTKGTAMPEVCLESDYSCSAFMRAFCEWLACGCCCSALSRLQKLFIKQKV